MGSALFYEWGQMNAIVLHVDVGFKRIFVLVEPLFEAPPSLPSIRLVAIRACQFVRPATSRCKFSTASSTRDSHGLETTATDVRSTDP